MASIMSDAEVHSLLSYRYRGAAWSPGTVYIGMSSTTPTSTGSNVTEPTDGNYARVAVTRTTGNWSAPASRATSNAVALTWPASTGGGSGYPGITHLPMYDAASGGNFIGFLTVTGGPVSFGAGVTPSIPVGSAVLTAAA